MANSSLTLSSLDFDTLKSNFKEFLKTQSVFKDYDFDGSNISVLLDVMSYNSYLNSFYLNMVASEMFLDSAQKYDSVVSHAKELNYLPRSNKSSVAEVNISFNTVGINSLVIPKGTRFNGINSNGSYVFTTNETKVLTSSNSTFSVSNLQIFEGDYFQDSYVVDYDIENQQFLITNENVDIYSITVNILENNGASNTEYKRVENLYGLNGSSKIYFLQGTQNGLYEVTFGDGLFGKRPLNGSTVSINYRISTGIEADSSTNFILSDDLGVTNQGDVSVNSLTTVSISAGGAEKETIDSIRFTAPRYFAAQQRAVTNDDYSSLIFANFGGEISDVSVYGGQEVEPKQYGRVIVALKSSSGTIVPDYVKNKISRYLSNFIAIPNRLILEDPDVLYCEVNTTVQYNPNITVKSPSEIETLVAATISNYSKNNLELFQNDLRYSKLVTDIDNTDTSIVSNNTELRVIKRWSPELNTLIDFSFSFGNAIRFIVPPTNQQQPLKHPPMFTSSPFVYTASDGNDYTVQMQDNGRGIIYLYSTTADDIFVVENNIGTIDYSTGNVDIKLSIKSYNGQYIIFYGRTVRRDIFASKNNLIIIDPSDVTINVIENIQ